MISTLKSKVNALEDPVNPKSAAIVSRTNVTDIPGFGCKCGTTPIASDGLAHADAGRLEIDHIELRDYFLKWTLEQRKDAIVT